MQVTITIDGAGRVVIPKPLRDRFRLHAGAKLQVEAVGDHVELTPERPAGGSALVSKGGLLVVPSGGVAFDAAAAVESDRDDREDNLLPRR